MISFPLSKAHSQECHNLNSVELYRTDLYKRYIILLLYYEYINTNTANVIKIVQLKKLTPKEMSHGTTLIHSWCSML